MIFGQPIRQKVDYFRGSKQPKVIYHVLKNQKKVRHGPYQEYFINDRLKVSGFYFNGHKDSTWVWYTDRAQPKEIQYYSAGEKTGVWLYFLEGGAVVKRYDHDQDAALPAVLRMEVLCTYPASARQAVQEGTVTGRLHFKEECVFDHLEILTASDPVFAEAARQAYLKAMRLSAQYDIPIEGCTEGAVFFELDFRFQED